MARAIWSGVLTFGLVSVPVQLYTATEDHTVHFRQFQRGTSDRIRYQRVNEKTGKEVDYSDIVKGYDLGGGDYVIIEPGELDEIAPGKSQVIDIRGFVDLDQVEPVYFDRTYYLAPKSEEYTKVYRLLHAALEKENKTGIATVVMRGKQYLVALRAQQDVLVLHTLHWADEVRDPHRELPVLPEQAEAGEREVDTARQLIGAMSIDWHPEEYRDTYEERVHELVDAKAEGRQVVSAEGPPQATNVVDLMEALQRSVEQAAAGRQQPAAPAAAGGKAARGTAAQGKVSERKASEGKAAQGKAASEQAPAGRRDRNRPQGKRAERSRPTEMSAKAAKAAKAAKREGRPAARAAAQAAPGEPGELAELSKSELYRLAGEADIPGRSTMNRDQLIEALSKAAA